MLFLYYCYENRQIDPKNDAPMALSRKDARDRDIPLMGYGDSAGNGFSVAELTGMILIILQLNNIDTLYLKISQLRTILTTL